MITVKDSGTAVKNLCCKLFVGFLRRKSAIGEANTYTKIDLTAYMKAREDKCVSEGSLRFA